MSANDLASHGTLSYLFSDTQTHKGIHYISELTEGFQLIIINILQQLLFRGYGRCSFERGFAGMTVWRGISVPLGTG